jgi:hypothetical protein
MSLNWRQWSKSDIIYGIIIPVIVVLAIVGFSKLNSLAGASPGSGGIVIGITMELFFWYGMGTNKKANQ